VHTPNPCHRKQLILCTTGQAAEERFAELGGAIDCGVVAVMREVAAEVSLTGDGLLPGLPARPRSSCPPDGATGGRLADRGRRPAAVGQRRLRGRCGSAEGPGDLRAPYRLSASFPQPPRGRVLALLMSCLRSRCSHLLFNYSLFNRRIATDPCAKLQIDRAFLLIGGANLLIVGANLLILRRQEFPEKCSLSGRRNAEATLR
jgi:hypothetical protein